MRRVIGSLVLAVLSLALARGAAAEGTLRIGMTAADIPYTGGQPDNGFEGFRFVGYQIYEPLFNWDLSRSVKLPALVTGLAGFCPLYSILGISTLRKPRNISI